MIRLHTTRPRPVPFSFDVTNGILNVAKNALESMQEGGRLSIYLEARDHKAVIKVDLERPIDENLHIHFHIIQIPFRINNRHNLIKNIQQVILNVAKNALESMQEGGRLSIYLEARDHKAVMIRLHTTRPRPVPFSFDVTNGRKMCSSISSEMPIQVDKGTEVTITLPAASR
jgi:signal transduction histidine kinase